MNAFLDDDYERRASAVAARLRAPQQQQQQCRLLRATAAERLLQLLAASMGATLAGYEDVVRTTARARRFAHLEDAVARLETVFLEHAPFYRGLAFRNPGIDCTIGALALTTIYFDSAHDRGYLAYVPPLLRQLHERHVGGWIAQMEALRAQEAVGGAIDIAQAAQRLALQSRRPRTALSPALYRSLRDRGGTRFGTLHDDTDVALSLATGIDLDDPCVVYAHVHVFQLYERASKTSDYIDQDDHLEFDLRAARAQRLRLRLELLLPQLRELALPVAGRVRSFPDCVLPHARRGSQLERYLQDDSLGCEQIPSMRFTPRVYSDAIDVRSGSTTHSIAPLERWVDRVWGGAAGVERTLRTVFALQVAFQVPVLRETPSCLAVLQHMTPQQAFKSSITQQQQQQQMNSQQQQQLNGPQHVADLFCDAITQDNDLLQRLQRAVARERRDQNLAHAVPHELFREGARRDSKAAPPFGARRALTFLLWLHDALTRSGFRRTVPLTSRQQSAFMTYRAANVQQARALERHLTHAFLSSTARDCNDAASKFVGVSVHDRSLDDLALQRLHAHMTAQLPPLSADIRVDDSFVVTALQRNDALDEAVRVALICALNAARDFEIAQQDARIARRRPPGCAQTEGAVAPASFDESIAAYILLMQQQHEHEFERHVARLEALDALLSLAAKLPPYTLLRLSPDPNDATLIMLQLARDLACSPVWLFCDDDDEADDADA